MLYRVIIKMKLGKYFLAKGFNKKHYLIEMNKISKRFKSGADVYFYANSRDGAFCKVLTPISDEEAGVKSYN